MAQPLYQATYQGKYSGLKITMTRSLQAGEQPGSYQLHSHAKAFAGSIKEAATFY